MWVFYQSYMYTDCHMHICITVLFLNVRIYIHIQCVCVWYICSRLCVCICEKRVLCMLCIWSYIVMLLLLLLLLMLMMMMMVVVRWCGCVGRIPAAAGRSLPVRCPWHVCGLCTRWGRWGGARCPGTAWEQGPAAWLASCLVPNRTLHAVHTSVQHQYQYHTLCTCTYIHTMSTCTSNIYSK